jgi:hypothetical protein
LGLGLCLPEPPDLFGGELCFGLPPKKPPKPPEPWLLPDPKEKPEPELWLPELWLLELPNEEPPFGGI